MQVAPTHAGAVIFQIKEDQPLFLIISSSNGRHWVLPKGHIEGNENAEEAALREIREEAGIIGASIAALGIQHYQKFDEHVTAQYFLVKMTETVDALESRILRWEDESAAVKLLSFEEARAALKEGVGILTRMCTSRAKTPT